jgi:hypothetical protein
MRPRPARTEGCQLADLRIEHPDAEQVAVLFARLGLRIPVRAGAAPALIATLRAPRGDVELR